MQTKLTILENNGRRWIMHGQQPVGALCSTPIRTYVYPLFTPAGTTVLQECPPDHPHHQGIMVGQDFVNGHNFWAMGNPSHPLNTQCRGRVEERADETGVTLVVHLRWVTKGGQAVLNEERRIRFEVWEGFHFVEIMTTWTAEFGELFIGKTKEGGLGMRVHPQLETFWGGKIRSSAGKMGEAEVFDARADWIEVNGQIAGLDVGIVMMPHPSQPQIPWFVRDYGLHLHSPFRHTVAKIPTGGQTFMRVGFVAYDGKSDGSQAARAWQRYSNFPA